MRHLLMKYTECLSSIFYQQGLYELLLDQEIQQSKVASVLSAKLRSETALAKADRFTWRSVGGGSSGENCGSVPGKLA